jgi:hypothetical protein
MAAIPGTAGAGIVGVAGNARQGSGMTWINFRQANFSLQICHFVETPTLVSKY